LSYHSLKLTTDGINVPRWEYPADTGRPGYACTSASIAATSVDVGHKRSPYLGFPVHWWLKIRYGLPSHSGRHYEALLHALCATVDAGLAQ
jgi:hypothetical protein